ncbi:uncharacterized protein LOC123563571 [Mercenaria mercenaria]|uniref:uncharacterized protein LOC123563571 n=1 Tax=Mercenaria mercenaria TaxID=6596 RepID=UPI00234F7873|nr:uncharacterized protein LOC123563571 [Mercenaria mercenaria]
MRCRARTAYSLTITSFLLILVGWIIPFWFGRFYESSQSKKQWGLFYVILCEIGNCTNVAGVLNKANVDFGGAKSPIILEAISVLATVALALCFLGLVIVIIFHCHVCGRKYSYHNYVTGAAIVQFIAATFVFLTIILSAISTSVFFSQTPMDDVIEFPWSLLCFCIGEVPLISSAVIYLLITCRWKKYRHIYAKTRYMFHTLNGHGNGLHRSNEPLPDYTLDHRYRYKPYNRDSFIGYYRGSRDDNDSAKRSTHQRDYYFPRRSPWEKSRYYYTYPYNPAKINSSNRKQNRHVPSNTINSEYRRSRPKSFNGDNSENPRVWHTAGNWDTSLEKKMEAHRDIYMYL